MKPHEKFVGEKEPLLVVANVLLPSRECAGGG